MATVKTTEDVVNWLSEFSLTINDERQGTFSSDHKAYDCTLSYGNKHINLTYQSNPQFNGEPTVTDIVQSMVSDAQSFDKYRSIDEFANAFGYVESDIPISQVISAYNGCKDTYEWLCGNDGKPLYDNDLPVLSDVLDEHESEIRAAVEEIHQKKQELEAYNNPAIPEGFVSIQDVMQQFDLGDYGDQITDHDESEDIASAFAEIADGNVDIYYNKLLSWLPENYEWIEEAENQGLLEGCKGDLIKMTQMAQYECYTSDLYEHQDDIVSYFTANHLHDSGAYMISEDLAESLSLTGIDNNSRLDASIDTITDTIKDQLTSHFEELYGDSDLAEEMADKVIESNYTIANPCVMDVAVAREVNDKGYDQAFDNQWKDTLNDWKDILRSQHIEKLEQIIEKYDSDPYAMIATINFPVWNNLPTEEVFEEWYVNDYENLPFEKTPENTFTHNPDILNDSFERLDAMIEKPENRWSPTLSTHDTDKETMTISSVSKDMSASSKEIKEHNTPVKEDYQLLSRLQADCEYYLGACAANQVDMDEAQKHLWAGTIEGQIDKMKELYQSFPESKKPEWISPAAIDQYEKKMLSARDNTLQTHRKDTTCSLSSVAESSRKNSDSLAVDGRGTDEPFTR